MRRKLDYAILTLMFAAAWPGLAWAGDIEAVTKVTAATIYSDRALVTRSGTAALATGPQTIVVEDMPAGLDESSLRVQGEGDAPVKIGAVEVKRVYLAELAQQAEREKNKALETKRDERSMIEAEIRALQVREQFIDRIGANGVVKHPQADLAKMDFTPEAWAQAWTLLQQGIAETQKGLVTKQIAMRAIDEEIARLQNELAQVQTNRRERRDIVIHVEAKAATAFDFTLTYQTPGAYWRPVYDARLDTGKAELLLEQYGQVAQQTGEDWANVSLTFSTARPELGTEMPRLAPWYIQSIQEVMAANRFLEKQMTQRASNAPMAMGASMMEADRVAEMESRENKSDFRRKEAELSVAQAVVSDYAAEFRVPGRVDLKSVSDPSKFFVGKQAMKATLFAQATPRLAPQAYLFANVVNGEKFPVIPGMAAKYRDGAFMGNAPLKLLRPGEQTGLSFGVDDRVKVEYEKTKQGQDNPTLLFVGDITATRTYKSKIRNLHDKPMAITVFDQYPVSGDPDVKVELAESETTPGFEKDKDNRQGVIVWKGQYQPQEEKELDITFRVKYPKNRPAPNF